MTPREKFIKCLKGEPVTGHVPHFELVMFLTMEALGRVHPLHRSYYQWNQMSEQERNLHLEDMALAYIESAEKYHHSAILVHPNPGVNGDITDDLESARMILEKIRELSGDKYALFLHGDPTMAIPDGSSMMEISVAMYEEPEKIHERTKRRCDQVVKTVDMLKRHEGLLDGFILCSDYCLNANPFYSCEMFDEFVVPYLKETLDYFRENGFYSIKHTDGNVMPILRQIADCGPDAIHSLDPQGGVSLSEARKIVGPDITLIGNVNCGLLQTGTDEECRADVMRSLREGMADGKGYIFSTSNCVYTGLDLRRYEMMLEIWEKYGIYEDYEKNFGMRKNGI